MVQITENQKKIVTAKKSGGSVKVPLTGFVEEGKQYLVEKTGYTVTLIPVDKAIKDRTAPEEQ